jgi:HSF-type DNA-binding
MMTDRVGDGPPGENDVRSKSVSQSRKRTYDEVSKHTRDPDGTSANVMNVDNVDNVDGIDDDDDEDDDNDIDPSTLVMEPLPMNDGDDGDGEYDEELIQIQEEAIRRIQRIWRMTNQERRRQQSDEPNFGSPAFDDDGLVEGDEPHKTHHIQTHTRNNSMGKLNGAQTPSSSPDTQQQQDRTSDFMRRSNQLTQAPSHPPPPQSSIHSPNHYFPQHYYFHPLPSSNPNKQQLPGSQKTPNVAIDNSIPLSPTIKDQHHPPIIPPFPGHTLYPHPIVQQHQQDRNTLIDNDIHCNRSGHTTYQFRDRENAKGPQQQDAVRWRGNSQQQDNQSQQQHSNDSTTIRTLTSPPPVRPDAMEPRTWWDTGETTEMKNDDRGNDTFPETRRGTEHKRSNDDNNDFVIPQQAATDKAINHNPQQQRCSQIGLGDTGTASMKPPLPGELPTAPAEAIEAGTPTETSVVRPSGQRPNRGRDEQGVAKMPPHASQYPSHYSVPYPYPHYYFHQSYFGPQQQPFFVMAREAHQRIQPTDDNKALTKETQQSAPPQNGQRKNPLRGRQSKEGNQKQHETPSACPPTLTSFEKRVKHDETYILRMNDILEDAERDGYTHVVSWLDHGRAFKVHIPEIFYNAILPKYFSTTKHRSFTRWLRAWGFERHTEGKDRGAWYHRFFIRGVVTTLVKDLTRKQMKDAMEEWLSPGELPDFYDLSIADEKLQSNPIIRFDSQTYESTGDARRSAVSHDQMSNTTNTTDAETNRNDVAEEIRQTDNNPGPVSNPKKLRGTILAIIRQMLSEADEKNFSHIVSWLGHGKAWKIHKRQEFASHIMGKYFDVTQLTHISDTLRRWGFQRLKNAEKKSDRNAYYHCLFQRDRPKLCRHLTQDQMLQAMNEYPSWRVGEPGGLDLKTEGTGDTAERIRNQHARPVLSPKQKMPRGNSSRRPQSSDEKVEIHGSAMKMDAPDARSITVVGETNESAATTDKSILAVDDEKTLPLTCNTNVFNSDMKNEKYVTRIYKMLEDAEQEGNEQIIGWRPHGRAFAIYDVDAFAEVVLPRYFKASYSSFIRWLRGWGFQRMQGGKDRKCWYHRLFVRGVTDLVRGHSRQEMLKAMENWLPPRVEPDFYKSGSETLLAETPNPLRRQEHDLHLQQGSGHSLPVLDDTTNCESVRLTTQNLLAPAAFEQDQQYQGSTTEGTVLLDPKRLRGSFVEDVRQMLDAVKSEGREDVVSWQDHGLAFRVHNKSEFATSFMPRFFKSKQYSYFCDVLRTWGFVRLKDGDDNGAYFHKLFIRDDPALSLHLSRNQMKHAMADWTRGQERAIAVVGKTSVNATITTTK